MTNPDEKRRPARGGARDNRHGEEKHTAPDSSTALRGSGDAPHKRLPFVRLDAAFHLAKIFDMTPADAGEYFKKLLIAIATETRGLMSEADEMLDEAQAYFDAKRKAGQMGGLTTQGKRSSDASSDASSHSYNHPSKHSGTQSLDHRARSAAKEYPPNATNPRIL